MNRFQPIEQIQNGVLMQGIVDTHTNTLYGDWWAQAPLRNSTMEYLNSTAFAIGQRVRVIGHSEVDRDEKGIVRGFVCLIDGSIRIQVNFPRGRLLAHYPPSELEIIS